ncbi:G-protein coupled receptor 35 [Alexandromys fortis]|uniref:G-protein coupled receptor 35 n=1 Tax=Alexandromys fortis TaxID=100897 RepID=UPI00215329EB|nr:G-protein coupled receptor 35 [Microtus fortis]XP_049981978.1 G-protein coupled receptor 35 [Microtus fortis]XP_049981979.1 G-protein coupled receptor 35 [Microtus fortis]XP_049981980.1 G-protein coupled receptor 35 [Microtus fortis]
MNATCNSDNLWPNALYYVFGVYLVLLLVLGLLLNGLALWVFCCRMRQWTETRVYMTNLAVADLCLLCSLPFVLHSLKHTSDTPVCQLSQGIYLANRYMSISLVTVIAVDRYVAVRHPIRARELRSPRKAAAVCLALWVVVLSSLVVRWHLGLQEGGFCFRNYGRHGFSTIAFSLLGFYLPLAIVVFCSLQVVTALGQRPATDVVQVEVTRRATHMIWANLAVFIICFLPLHVVLTVKFSLGLSTCAAHFTFSRALSITGKLSDANCCLDAICYYYMAKEFQDASMSALSSSTPHKSQDSQSLTLT